MSFSIPTFLGLCPSFIWLLFFLRKDSHPESSRMILKIFFFGMLITFVAAFVELGIESVFDIENKISAIASQNDISSIFYLFFYNFIGIAIIEEFLKYLVVREKVIKDPEFDEPVDTMLYMIIAGLGFAALENILYIWPADGLMAQTYIFIFRFVGSTLLHALCSALLGYFLALSFYHTKNRFALISTGLITASLLHAFFNFFIIKSSYNYFYLYAVIIMLAGLASFISVAFKKLKAQASICKIMNNK
jgi:RsiW-degrading membrane proteinase PrsW (M82 family)